ncbi:MAG: hypothetical protein K2X72_31590 [Reyranella sp.]|nr:hypothetical protein [Reyranella sp.]
MFKWLFGKGTPEPDTKEVAETRRFESAFDMVLERARNLKNEYERTLNNPEIAETLEGYKDPAYIAECRQVILSTVNHPEMGEGHRLLPVVSTMFMTMATEVFPSNSGFERFWRWANAYSPEERRALVRFAYLATVWEQEQAGPRHPVSFASRIILMTLAANANEDPTSKDVARELLAYIDRARANSHAR